MSNRLAEGQPLTYDYLAQIENELDRLRSQVSALSGKLANIDGFIQDIIVLHDNSSARKNAKKFSDVLIIAGSDIVSFSGNTTKKVFQKAVFDESFANVPTVVATVQDPGSQGSNGANVAFATVSLGQVSKTDFWYKLELIRSSGAIQNNDLRVNYIAIGRRNST